MNNRTPFFLFLLLLPVALSAQSSLNTWTKYPNNPVYFHNTSGAWDVASDPAVIKDGGSYVMIVSGDGGTSAGSVDGNTIIMARSADGYAWSTLANGQNGVVLTGYDGEWDESMEMPELIEVNNFFRLFYCGYDPHYSDSTGGLAWGDLGMAVSADDSVFTRLPQPVMTRTSNWYDQDGITDPTIVASGDTLYMIYVGWCTQGCALNNGNPAFYSLKAISTDTGHTWTKLGLLDPTGLIGLQHPDLVRDADGMYSLFFGVDNACSNVAVGVFHSTGPAPFGPFTPVSANPIFCMGTQPFEVSPGDGAFPSVLNDNGTARMYYTGVDDVNFYFRIGLVESNTVIGIPAALPGKNTVRLFPNPVTTVLNMEAGAPGVFEIYNAHGELIFTRETDALAAIDVWQWPAGLYVIKKAGSSQPGIRFVKTND